ncbi:BglG family transcription antiterminator [Streptococcus orisasini]|uniref:BglG family transcription antiterminator n=1 Tax=Streptococcus orisasini TaxID=1080071 RepID=UPI00070D34B1|nr:PRD domain-containing protein [Streptococcus orisasini]
MLGQKEKLIVNYLSQHRDRFVTSKELAEHLSCSDRTARTHIKSLMTYSPQKTGAQIIAKQGYGYQLKVIDDQKYLSFLSENNKNQVREMIDINDRYHYILNKLIFEQDKIFFDDLMDQLYVSRSTLSSDFKKIRKELLKYDLRIESRANKGVFIKGSEHDKRRFIMDYFFSGRFLKNLHQYVSNDFFKLPISFEELTIIVLDECRSEKLKLSDLMIQNLIVHIALAIKRVTDGFELSPIAIDSQKFDKEIIVAERIFKRIKKRIARDFPREEINYIALHLIAKKSSEQPSKAKDGNIRMQHDLTEALRKIDSRHGYHFANDFTLIEGLLVHLEVLEERLKIDVHLDNPLLTDIKEQYGSVFQLTKELLGDLSAFADYTLSDDEIAYIALHLMAALERQKEEHKLNVLVICATGYGSAQMLKNRIKNELSPYVHIVDLIGYYDISNDKLQDIDLIISSIDLSNLVFSVPVLTVSVFLKDEEVAQIKEKILTLQSSPKKIKPEDEVALEQVFDDYFSESYFQIFDSADKEELLKKMVSCLNDKKDANYTKCMLSLVHQREEMSTVAFSDVIAVPHPLKAVDKIHKIAVAVIKKGIAWDKHFTNVQLVFLVSPSIYENEGLPAITKRIVDLTDQKEVQKKLLASESFEAFKEIFLSE